MAVRFAEKFENTAASLTYSWQTYAYEWSTAQGLRLPGAQIAGADYLYDLRGSLQSLKEAGLERVRWMALKSTAALLDTEVDSARSVLYRGARGKLFTIDAAATRRWCYARVMGLPEFTVTPLSNSSPFLSLAMIAEFRRQSDWYGAAQSVNQTVAASPTTWTVTNPGNANAYAVVMRLRANTGTGFVNPRLDNLTNGYYWSSTRDSASADDELKVDAGAQTVQYSVDDGVSYANDFSLFSRGTDQIAYMVLAPGDNTIRYTGGGSPSLDVTITFDSVYH